jgi:hypothetical protein
MQRTLLALVFSIVLLHVFAGSSVAQTTGLSIRLTSPSSTAWETEQSSIDLQGTAMASSGLSSVRWVNQLGGAWVVGRWRKSER